MNSYVDTFRDMFLDAANAITWGLIGVAAWILWFDRVEVVSVLPWVLP